MFGVWSDELFEGPAKEAGVWSDKLLESHRVWSSELLEGSGRSEEVLLSAKFVFQSVVEQDAEVGTDMPCLCFLDVYLTLYCKRDNTN